MVYKSYIKISRVVIFSIVLMNALPSIVTAESIWVKYGNQIIKGAGDARAIALSEAQTASAKGPLSILWNPARLLAHNEKYIAISHHERFAKNVIFDVIGFDLKDNLKSKWSLVVIRQSIKGIPNTRNALYEPDLAYMNDYLDSKRERILADSITFFDQVQWAGVLGFATTLGKWNIGGNVKGLVHRLGNYSGYGIGFDFGTYIDLSTTNVLAFSIRDITTSWVIWESGTVERISPEFNVGDVQTFFISRFNLQVDIMMNMRMTTSGTLNSNDFSMGSLGGDIRVGLDFVYKNDLHLRFGRNPITNHSFGIGMTFVFGDLDYAFTPSPVGSVLGSSHYISLRIKLDYLQSLREKLIP